MILGGTPLSAFRLLAVSTLEHAVWLMFGFYLLNLLVPIIPAVIIYRLFPENKSSIEGGVTGCKIKTTGAWGAYVTAFVLGFWAIRSTAIPTIKAVGGKSVWTINPDFQLVDENGIVSVWSLPRSLLGRIHIDSGRSHLPQS